MELQLGSMQIADPDSARKLVGPDEIVIGERCVELEFNYPLARPEVFRCEADRPEGITRLHLARFVQETYFRIYEEEEAQAGQPGLLPGTLNRAPSDGPYGIWGHCIEDLALEGVERNGPGRYELIIGS